jgi:localization factor PodJL
MTTKAYAKPEELSAAAGGQQGKRVCASCPANSGKRAVEQARVARTAEAIEERLSAMTAGREAEAGGDALADADERLRHIKNYLKSNPAARARTAAAHHSSGAAPRSAPGAQGRAWFEARFGELRGAVERLASVNSFGAAKEMEALNVRLDDLMGRVDCALESQSHEAALKSLECQLAGLAGYLESTKAWAEERHAGVAARFDGVEARLENLGQAVEQSQKSIQTVPEQTVAQISEAMRRMPPPPGLIRIERDVRSLSEAAREHEGRTAEAVSELHGALRMILDQLASMGEKLSGVGDMLEDARERGAAATDEVRISSGGGDVEAVKDEAAFCASAAGLKQARSASQSPAKGHSQSIAFTQLNKRPDSSSTSTEQQGSKLALAGALIILALTGAAMFVRQLSDVGRGDFAGAVQSRLEGRQTLSALPGPQTGPADRVARASGAAPAGSNVGVLAARREPGAAASAPSRPQEASVPRPFEGGGVLSEPEFRTADGFALPSSLGTEPIRLAAIAGDPNAQYTVASFYEAGQGVARDPAAAARWFRRAAEQNHAPSEYRLATLYERGQGVRRDLAAAQSLYQSAAELGNVKAMHNLAVLLVHRQGEAPDYAAAAKWFSRAAERGFADSQYNLAILYEQGLGVSRSTEAAYRWFALSAKGGDRQAQSQRDRVGAALTVAAAAKVDAELLGWRAAAIDEAANAVQTSWEQPPQAQAGGEQLPSGDGGKSHEPPAVRPKPAAKKPGEVRRKKVRTEANGAANATDGPQLAARRLQPDHGARGLRS